MKKLLYLFLIGLLTLQCKSQVTFCPPGAEWHYLFNFMGFLPGNTYNETIRYVGDTIEGLDKLRILMHKRFFLQCSPLVTRTLIKQKGDTIFFKNGRTQNAWQILYNFAVLPGQGWSTTVLQNDASSTTFTYSVDSVKQISVNGFNLNNLYITKGTFPPLGVVKFQITERFGSSRFLFDFDNKELSLCDAESFGERLCYQDSSFGITQFSSKSCDYYTINTVGFDEQINQSENVIIYPNPARDQLNVNFSNANITNSVSVLNCFGQLVSFSKVSFSENTIDLSKFAKGIYFLLVTKEGEKCVYKFLKE